MLPNRLNSPGFPHISRHDRALRSPRAAIGAHSCLPCSAARLPGVCSASSRGHSVVSANPNGNFRNPEVQSPDWAVRNARNPAVFVRPKTTIPWLMQQGIAGNSTVALQSKIVRRRTVVGGKALTRIGCAASLLASEFGLDGFAETWSAGVTHGGKPSGYEHDRADLEGSPRAVSRRQVLITFGCV